MSSLSGKSNTAWPRSIFVGAVAVGAVAWMLLFAGAFGGHRATASGVLQVVASGGAAVVLTMTWRRGNAPLGRAIPILAVGAALWCATDIGWWAVDEFTLGDPQWLNLGYAAATAVYAAAAWSIAGSASPGTYVHPVTRGLGFLDGVLIAAAIAVWWLFEVWEPLVGGAQAITTLVPTAADAAFLAGALACWARADSRRRPAASVLVLAAVVLATTDVFYARTFVDYSPGHVLDLGWTFVSATIAGSAFRPPWTQPMRRPVARSAARSLQVLLAPVLVIVVLGFTAGRHDTPIDADHRPLHLALWCLVWLLVVRECVQLAEHFMLNRRLERAAEDLRHRAEHDDLTGLLTGQAFHQRVDRALADRHNDGEELALLWIDIDSFKRVNELLGTDVGDRVLAAAAGRVRAVSHPDDLVARYYSDTFVALRSRADDDVDAWAERIRSVLADRFDIDGVHVRLTCALGLLGSATAHSDAAQLLSAASIAMTDVRHHGHNQVVRHSLADETVSDDRRQLAVDLRAAIDEDQLRVHYQPICDIRTGRVLGSEALLRFRHPSRGDLGPDQFLPVAVATGLMPELASLVLREACATFAEDPTLGWVTVNLSESDLADPRLVDRVRDVLGQTGLEPGRLLIELSERVVPQADIVRGIDRLRELGVGLALDDFGSAWTSLAQVRRLAIRLVKLDRSMIERLDGPDREQYAALVRTIVGLADVLGLVVLAEGIETEAELAECRAAGVVLGQGFLWAPALPVTALVRYVTSAGSALLDPSQVDPLAR